MEVDGAKAAAAIMGMNNIYYRFLHLVEDGEYQTMPARLRMNVIANHGIDKLDFELISLAVSAVNGCGLCVTSHEKKLRSHDVSREAIQSAVRIAATVHAVAVALEFEQSEPVAAGTTELAAYVTIGVTPSLDGQCNGARITGRRFLLGQVSGRSYGAMFSVNGKTCSAPDCDFSEIT